MIEGGKVDVIANRQFEYQGGNVGIRGSTWSDVGAKGQQSTVDSQVGV
jgi:hypothetical protein